MYQECVSLLCSDPSSRCKAVQGYRQSCWDIGIEVVSADCDEDVSPTTAQSTVSLPDGSITPGITTEEPGDKEPDDKERDDKEPDDKEPGDKEPDDKEPGDKENRCSQDTDYKESVSQFCKELLFTVSLENVLCSQVRF